MPLVTASEEGIAQTESKVPPFRARCAFEMWFLQLVITKVTLSYHNDNLGQSSLEQDIIEGENPVLDLNVIFFLLCSPLLGLCRPFRRVHELGRGK